ncbi:MAG: glycosyltransferase [Actinomycetota bacterium]|nr:glycosyltransferase [Actinomycetota bacterium]
MSHVFPRSPSDAAAPFLLRYAAGLAEAGVAVRVVAPHDPGLPDAHDVAGIPVRRVRYGPDHAEDLAYRGEMHVRVRRPRGAVRAVRLVGALARTVGDECRSWGPHVVDVHWLVPGGVVTWLAGVRLPSQVVVHGTDVALVTAGPIRRVVARRLLDRFHVVAASSGPLAEELRSALGRPADAVAPMPYAAPPADPGPPPGQDRILAIGRLVAEKGHADLVEAVATLRAEGRRSVSLTVVGDGPERDRLAAMAEERDVPLTLPGAVSPADLEARYARADVVAVPSHREGFGLVAAEALAQQRPVVASNVGGLAEIVTDGVTGWVVPPRDPRRLKEALAAALDDPDEGRRRAAAGARRVRERWSAAALGRDAADRLTRLAASERD